ncbi:MobF family relaxase [Actinomadura montaniterrae]|uniref:MobF family relaxase n=1 Tax=Actinomadura montaniterrae TaxID=1803903 RepID=UPI00178C1F09|nr:MobF family relaxase [Actinomadura montaniterrae]
MAIGTLAPGYDPRYLTREVGRGAENYYLSSVVEHGEPPGIWWGEGARALGLEPGTEIDAATFERLYEHFHDPRSPDFHDGSVPDEEKERLGRRKSTFKSWEEIFEKKMQAEPEASPERLDELRYAAKKEARQAVILLDATFSPPKSTTLVHAGLLASASEAEKAGNEALAARYREAADTVWEGVMVGAEAYLNYLQEHAGDARVGYHGAKSAGRTTGRWVEAGGWVVGRFRQHTNRNDDPQLHVHQAILNRQQTADGKWVTLDSRALFKARPGASAVGARAMEEFHARRLGLKYVTRPDGKGREVEGVSAEQIAAYSTRRVQVTKDLEERIAAYVSKHGRQPSPRTLFNMAQHATNATKRAKNKEHAVSASERLRQWEERSRAQEIGELKGIPGQTLGRIAEGQAPEELGAAEVDRVISAAVAEVQAGKTSFSRFELVRALEGHLPDYLGGLHQERVEALLEDLTEMALGSQETTGIRLLNAPEVVQFPAEMMRPDGRSIYQAPAAERFTTAAFLDREATFIGSALQTDAPRLDPERARELVGMSVEEAKRAALEGQEVPDSDAPRPFQDQADAIVGLLTSGRRVDPLIGAAGTGKSFTVSKFADLWRAEFGTPVLGLTIAQNAANVLKGEGLDDAINAARWLTQVNRGEASLIPGQAIVLDEANMMDTDTLEQVRQLADAAGCKIVAAGDHRQLSAVGAGGLVRRLVDVGGSQQLTTVVRFREEWEREASVQLRDGMPEALRAYDHHGRLYEGTREEMEQQAFEAALADRLDGKQTLLMVGNNERAAELAGRIRDELVALGKVEREGLRLHDGNTVAPGDEITARLNVEIEEGVELTNRDTLQVGAINEDGSLLARWVRKDGQPGEDLVTIKADYVRENIELAYAGTVHSAEGRTVDTGYGVPDEQTTAEALYVMSTRGREGNWLYVPVEHTRQADMRPGPVQAREESAALLRDVDGAWAPEAAPLDDEAAPQPERPAELDGDRISVLTAILENREEDQTATEAMIEEGERPRNLAHLGAIITDQIREKLPLAYIRRAEERGTLSPADAAALRQDEALGTLGRLLHRLELSDHNADRILDAAIAERELDSAESVAKTLTWRIGKAAEERGIDLDRLEISEKAITTSWRDRIPATGDPRTDELLGELGDRAQMRQAELGYDTLDQPPAWLVEEIGPAPAAEDLDARAAWAERAAPVMAYREQYGYEAESDAIGPAPSRKAPEQRAAWWAARDALGNPDASREISGASDGELWVMRAAYEREAAWAPAYVGDELSQVSREARERAAEAVRLRARAAAIAGRDAEAAAALEARADGQQTLADAADQQRRALTQVYEARKAWAEATRDAALLAQRADAELRRREHIDAAALPPLHADTADAHQRIEQQRAAEAERRALDDAQRVPDGQLELDLGPSVERLAAWDAPAPTTGEQAREQDADRMPPLTEAEQQHVREQMALRDQVAREQEEYDRQRRAYARGELDELPPDPRDHAAAGRVRAMEAEAEREAAAAAERRAQAIRHARAQAEADRQAEAREAEQRAAQLAEQALARHQGDHRDRAAEPEHAPEADRPAAAMPGQQALDVFGVAERGEVDREAQPDLAERVEKAAAAAAIAGARQERQEHEQRAQQEREHEELQRAQEREQERTEAERAKLEARTQQQQRERSAAQIAAEAFPQGVREALAQSMGHERDGEGREPHRPAPRRGPEPPSRDGGLGR